MRHWLKTLFILPALAVLLTACGDEAPKELPPERTLTILAGSELKDVEPLLPKLEAETGIRLKFEYSGTLDGVERLQAGEAFDAAWFSHAKYLMLDPTTRAKVKASEKIMLSPVVLGVKESRFKALGWDKKAELTWKDIAQAAASGQFNFAMTNPTSSNTGFSALMGVAAAFAGKADALTEQDVAQLDLTGLFKGQKLTAGSSGWLAERYLAEADRLDGMINYESVLLGLNVGTSGAGNSNVAPLKDKLHLVYPRDGIVTADYPLLLLNDAKRAAYDKVVAWLKSAETQQALMRDTRRRPVNPSVASAQGLFPDALLSELPFPNRIEVVNKLLFSYLNDQRRPAHAFFVLDISGSMEGERLQGLRAALTSLAGGDTSLTGRFARFQNRERISLIPFSSGVEQDLLLAADMGKSGPENDKTLNQIRTYAGQLGVRGGTALYDAVAEAYRQAALAMKNDPQRYYTIVAMTDGESNTGMTLAEFKRFYASLPPDVRQVRVFTVLFGDSDPAEMKTLAELTGGHMFDSRKTSLSRMFKSIRGYQ
ncbi:MAG: VWA domain-containing protein [Pseudomonadota bacterium]|nr:VWA domain-containing protein [Pseudomonadota bacterium]